MGKTLLSHGRVLERERLKGRTVTLVRLKGEARRVFGSCKSLSVWVDPNGGYVARAHVLESAFIEEHGFTKNGAMVAMWDLLLGLDPRERSRQ